MLKVLYGRLAYKRKIDIIVLPLKFIYIIYTFPFLVFTLLLALRSLGAFGNAFMDNSDNIGKILLHFSAIVISFGLWIFISMMIENILLKNK